MRGASSRCDLLRFAWLPLVGLALVFSSPSRTHAHGELQGQAPNAEEKKYQPRKVVLQLVRKADGRPIPGASVVAGSYLFRIPKGMRAASLEDRPERVTDQEGRCMIEIPTLLAERHHILTRLDEVLAR
jgi:hypothetical protein